MMPAFGYLQVNGGHSPGHVPQSAPLHLRQHRLSLGKPQGHVHRPVQHPGRPKREASLLSLSRGGIQQAETAVAVGLEWAHTEFLGQGQGLLVVGFGLLGIGGIGVGMDDAKLVQRERLVPAFLLLPG